jgi:hypothetical protein
MSGSRHDYAFAGLSTKDKAGFDYADNGETSRPPENTIWNPSLGHVPKFANRVGSAVHRVLFGRVRPN